MALEIVLGKVFKRIPLKMKSYPLGMRSQTQHNLPYLLFSFVIIPAPFHSHTKSLPLPYTEP